MKFKEGNHCLSVRQVKEWTRLPREAVEAPSLEMLKTQLDYMLSKQHKVTLLEQLAGTKGSLEVPSTPSDSQTL